MMLYLASENARKKSKPQKPSGNSSPYAEIAWPERYQSLAEEMTDPRLKAYYQAGMIAGDTPIGEAPLVAVDFETTGFDPQQHGIVSIGVVPMTLHRIQMSQARQWVLNPKHHLTDESVVIHGITHSEIEDAPDIDDILDNLLQRLAGKVWVVHYHGIERPFIQATLLKRLQHKLEFPLIDTMALEARWHRNQPRSWWDKVKTQFGKPPPQTSIRLADSRERYHLPWYPPHNAATDALGCAELLQAQVSHRFSPDTPIKEIWMP